MNQKFFALSKEKQSKIINAGLEQFAKFGYQHASTGNIAAAAGISKALLFHYFQNKKEFYLYLYQYSVELQKSDVLSAGFYTNMDLFEMFRLGVKVKCQLMREYRYLNDFLIQAYYDDTLLIRDSLFEYNDNLLEESIILMLDMADKEKLRPEIDLRILMDVFINYSDGYLRRLRYQQDLDVDKIETEIMQFLLFFKTCCYKEEYL